MSYTNKALALVWLVVFGLAVLSGSGAIAGPQVLWLVAAALGMPALILTLCVKPRRTTLGPTTASEPPDASGIDLYRWENDGGAPHAA